MLNLTYIYLFVDVSNSGEVVETSFSLSKLIMDITTCSSVPENVAGAFGVTLLFLLLFSVFKFFIGNGLTKKEWSNLMLEFPIDVSVAVATLQTTLLTRVNSYLYNATLAISFIVAVICCMIRRKAIEKMDNRKHFGYAFWGIASFVLVVLWLVCLIYIIF